MAYRHILDLGQLLLQLLQSQSLSVWTGMARTVNFLSFTLTKVVQDHGKGTATKQKRKVLAILLGVGLEALEGRKKKRTY